MDQWPKEWFDLDMEQCWDKLWFLWRSSHVRNQLVCNRMGVNPIPVAYVEYDEWAGWRQEMVVVVTNRDMKA